MCAWQVTSKEAFTETDLEAARRQQAELARKMTGMFESGITTLNKKYCFSLILARKP